MATHKSYVDTTTDVVDVADTAPRYTAPKGKKIKAVPFSNATTVVVRAEDFKSAGIEHKDVTWDFRLDDFCVVVGDVISKEAADFLVKNYSDSFHYVGE